MKSTDGRFEYWDASGEPLPEGKQISDVHRVAFRCRTHNKWCSVPTGPDAQHPRKWGWNGNVNAPTLAPSINCHECWHGFIENGVFLTTDKKPEAKQ